MGSMKRIDVLKGIEQILVEKAYETGHISHRADGDWQKQADGSWTPYKGQSAQNPNKKDRYGFSLLPDEDKQGYLDRANGDPYQAQILYEKDVENSPMGGLDEEEDQYDEITEEDLKESYGDDDWDRYDDITDMIQNTDWESIVSEYDDPSVDQIISDYNLPDDERIRDEISTYIHTDDSDEDYEQDEDLGLDNVQKSAVRDMQSAPTTKNMGF